MIDACDCPYFTEGMGMCFKWCDLSSDHTCGTCSSYYFPDKRNPDIGFCPFSIGRVNPRMKTNCPHYHEYVDGELRYQDWVEMKVIELGGQSDSEPENRALRKYARSMWLDSH
jgi:hypothetical protein